MHSNNVFHCNNCLAVTLVCRNFCSSDSIMETNGPRVKTQWFFLVLVATSKVLVSLCCKVLDSQYVSGVQRADIDTAVGKIREIWHT